VGDLEDVARRHLVAGTAESPTFDGHRSPTAPAGREGRRRRRRAGAAHRRGVQRVGARGSRSGRSGPTPSPRARSGCRSRCAGGCCSTGRVPGSAAPTGRWSRWWSAGTCRPPRALPAAAAAGGRRGEGRGPQGRAAGPVGW